jgi:glycosyltransferase involved in cell wall biosynthesis
VKIGINARILEREVTGVPVYTARLIDGLRARGVALEIYSYGDLPGYEFVGLLKSSGLSSPGMIRKLWWEKAGIRRLVGSDVTVFHGPHTFLPVSRIKGIRYVVTVHDFGTLRCPHYYGWRELYYHKMNLRAALSMADRIICPSVSCRSDLGEFFPEFLAKSVVIHLGYDDFSTVGSDDSILQEYGLSGSSFLLTVGTHGRKNLPNTVSAVKRMVEKGRHVRVVVVGTPTREALRIAETERDLIILVGNLGRARLASLYRNASALLFLSHYEGFGLPVLEAMNCNLPVVASRIAPLREVTGYDEACLADPDDIDDICSKIMRTLDDEIYRKRLVAHGASWKNRFSWEKMIDETLELYRSVISSR